MYDHIICGRVSVHFKLISAVRVHVFTERDTRRLTCIASDVRDKVRNRGQDNVTNINTGSGVRRILFKRRQCIYKSEQRYINENLLTRNARARPHTAFLWLFSKDCN